mgnify:FL=1
MEKEVSDFLEDVYGGYESDREFMIDLYKMFDVLLYGVSRQAEKNPLTVEEKDRIWLKLRLRLTDNIDATSAPFLLHFWKYIQAEDPSLYRILKLLAGGACHYSTAYENIFAEIAGNPKNVFATEELLEKICDVWDIPVEVQFARGLRDKKLFRDDNNLWDYSSCKRAPLVLHPWIVDYFFGELSLPESLIGKADLKSSFQKTEWIGYTDIYEQIHTLVRENTPINIVITGKDGCGKHSLIENIYGETERKLLTFSWEAYENNNDRQTFLQDAESFVEMVGADVCIFDYTAKQTEELTQERMPSDFSGFVKSLNDHKHILIMTMEEKNRSVRNDIGNVVMVRMEIPTPEERIMAWRQLLQKYESKELSPEVLGNKYRMHVGEIAAVLKNAFYICCSHGKTQITGEDIILAIRQKNSGELGPFAELQDPCFGWDDMIVEDEVHKNLRYIVDRILYRNVVGQKWGYDDILKYGKGVCALFYGPPGTGKTMAARVLANELGIDLYRIDLSRMVSKYVGETQKNITQLFERAKNMDAILFFDEADAFFSKRTEVSDANDRNSNSEVAHLLQKLEEYEGISILATNLKDNIDDAFKRRFKYMVHFQLPAAEERRALWKKMLPDAAPREQDINLDYFADKFELSGSEIKEVMVHAAYQAARQNKAVGNKELADAMMICMNKYGVTLTWEDFNDLLM